MLIIISCSVHVICFSEGFNQLTQSFDDHSPPDNHFLCRVTGVSPLLVLVTPTVTTWPFQFKAVFDAQLTVVFIWSWQSTSPLSSTYQKSIAASLCSDSNTWELHKNKIESCFDLHSFPFFIFSVTKKGVRLCSWRSLHPVVVLQTASQWWAGPPRTRLAWIYVWVFRFSQRNDSCDPLTCLPAHH